MQNPWLDIPPADYEGHMALPQIAQAQLLSEVFADVLNQHEPYSVAVPGCAGGNGFDRISTQITRRAAGIDINTQYVQTAVHNPAGALVGQATASPRKAAKSRVVTRLPSDRF